MVTKWRIHKSEDGNHWFAWPPAIYRSIPVSVFNSGAEALAAFKKGHA